ncbi:hypothetical protein ABIA45_002044 [Bradyrhizobium sp. USDA 336]
MVLAGCWSGVTADEIREVSIDEEMSADTSAIQVKDSPNYAGRRWINAGWEQQTGVK